MSHFNVFISSLIGTGKLRVCVKYGFTAAPLNFYPMFVPDNWEQTLGKSLKRKTFLQGEIRPYVND